MDNLPKAIQIVRPINHSFESNLNDLERILGRDDINNRYIVVVSIAGAFRKGKSFVMNFFLKYLYAQVILTKCHAECAGSCKGLYK